MCHKISERILIPIRKDEEVNKTSSIQPAVLFQIKTWLQTLNVPEAPAFFLPPLE